MSEVEPLESDSVYDTFTQWIISQKRLLRPDGLFIIGINGSVGQGKSYFSREIITRLNRILKPEEGQAITRSLDDYYLTKAERNTPSFRALGYNPKGISNRGPAGTHDVEQVSRDWLALKQNLPSSVINLPSFDKSIDDRSAQPFQVKGKVGVYLFEGWFVGAQTTVDASKTEPGLKRSVAIALENYKPLFERLDALWAFAPPASREVMVAQREEQEAALRRDKGSGMSPEDVRTMVRYFYDDSWQPGVTSPFPPKESANFWAVTDQQHRFLKIES